MGLVSLIFGLIAICISWLPGVGWLGVAMGGISFALGVPLITLWHDRLGNTGWGIAGIALGTLSVSVGYAYQIKHAAGDLDSLVYPLGTSTYYYLLGALLLIGLAGMILARKKSPLLGTILAIGAATLLAISGAWLLTDLDRESLESKSTAAANQVSPGDSGQ